MHSNMNVKQVNHIGRLILPQHREFMNPPIEYT